jgi:hypothetical protein
VGPIIHRIFDEIRVKQKRRSGNRVEERDNSGKCRPLTSNSKIFSPLSDSNPKGY